MTSRRLSTLVSGLVLTLGLTAGGPVRAERGFPGNSGPFALGSGTGFASGFSPFELRFLRRAVRPGLWDRSYPWILAVQLRFIRRRTGLRRLWRDRLFPPPRLCRAPAKCLRRPLRISRPTTPSPWSPAGAARRIGFAVDTEPNPAPPRTATAGDPGSVRHREYQADRDEPVRRPPPRRRLDRAWLRPGTPASEPTARCRRSRTNDRPADRITPP